MKERNKVFPSRPVSVRLFTLHDKPVSMFRAKVPDRHLIEIMIGNCIVRTFGYDKPADATAHYNQLLKQLGGK